MLEQRAPYGRHHDRTATERVVPLETTRHESSPQPYHGETYYGRPALKATTYHWLVTLYLFVGGLAGTAQLVSTLADLGNGKRNRSLVRAGRYLGFAGALLSPVLLTADLHTPSRWYNMLRIFRRTSPMSIGSWVLFAFGGLSTVAALAQF